MMQRGNIFADEGRKIEAFKNVDSAAPEVTCDCHGLSFADGKYWIDTEQIPGLLKGDGSAETSAPKVGDIGVYYENG